MRTAVRRVLLMSALMSPGVLQALGLGDIRLSSALNQPFDAEIELIAATQEDLGALRATLASSDTFTRYGLDRPSYLSDFTFRVMCVETAAAALGQRMLILKAANIAEIDAAFALVAQQRGNALMIGSDPFFDANRGHIVTLAARQAVPAIYHWCEYVAVGGADELRSQYW